MSIYDELVNRKTRLALVGLGYVGMPIAVAFSKKVDVIGFDLNQNKINLYKSGIDPTNEVGNNAIAEANIEFTSDATALQQASFIIVAVPTPVNADHTPDLRPVVSASETVETNLKRGSIVVYESTVYPGVTEDICIPILERESGLKCGIDFKVGYSPERINPGDKEHRLDTIVKVVSGMDEESLDVIAKTYELVVNAGVYRAKSIKVAEAAKVIENSQRDINIAFMNELSIIFNKMEIDTLSVLEAARTKWNFLDFRPGLVGGHCIGVDPYYLTYKASLIGIRSQVILSGRQINDGMGSYVADSCIKQLIKLGVQINDAKVAILGFTFKENCPDTRNTRVCDIISELVDFGVNPVVRDPIADEKETDDLYGIKLVDLKDINDCDAVIIATPHNEFKCMRLDDIAKLFKNDAATKLLIDVKGLFNRAELEAAGYQYWRL